jgi:hypothetical protein
MVVVALVGWTLSAAAQPAPPVMTLEPADAEAFRDIVDSTIPPRYNGALIRWYQGLLQKYQQKQQALQVRPPQTPEETQRDLGAVKKGLPAPAADETKQ